MRLGRIKMIIESTSFLEASFMPLQDQFLQLLSSPNEVNVLLAFEMAKGMPEIDFKQYLADYLLLWQCFFDKNLKKIDHTHVISLNRPTIEIRSRRIEFLPSEIRRLQNLENLTLFDNQLKAFPQEIGALKYLKDLNFLSNQVTELPAEIGLLSNLEVLSGSLNELQYLPEEINRLVNLRVLNFPYNRLTSLPKSIARLTKLQELNLPRNELTHLPEEMRHFSNLSYINLKNNPISNQEKQKIVEWFPKTRIEF